MNVWGEDMIGKELAYLCPSGNSLIMPISPSGVQLCYYF